MGWESNSTFQVVIISGPKAGLFVYSPSAGAGKLVASIAAAGGTDPYGNTYLQGITSYQASSKTVELTGASVFFASVGAFAAALIQTGVVISGTDALQLQSPQPTNLVTAGSLNIVGRTGGAGLVQVPAPTALEADAGLTVTGGITTDTELVTSAQAVTTLLQVTNTATTTNSAAHVRVTAAAGFTAQQIFYGAQVAGDTSLRIALDITAAGTPRIRFGPGNTVPDTILNRIAANTLALLSADFAIDTVGRGLQVKEGVNAKQGTAVLAAGTVVVANTSVTANSRIFLGHAIPGPSPGALFCSAITAGTGFTIVSTNGLDTGTVAYEIIEPAP